MSKIFKIVLLMIIGAVIGGLGASIFWFRFFSYEGQTRRMIELSELEDFVYKIYLTGDFDSSVIALNELVDKLAFYEIEMDSKNPHYQTIVTDLGLTHARLFLLYEKEGRQDLAEQKYLKAIELIGDKFKVDSKEELKGIIDKLGKPTQNLNNDNTN